MHQDPANPPQVRQRRCCVLMRVSGCYLPEDNDGCLLPEGHDCPHLAQTNDGLFRWETDWECDCEECMRGEGDYCIVYWRESKLPENALPVDVY